MYISKQLEFVILFMQKIKKFIQIVCRLCHYFYARNELTPNMILGGPVECLTILTLLFVEVSDIQFVLWVANSVLLLGVFCWKNFMVIY